jgi:hypothetical protein
MAGQVWAFVAPIFMSLEYTRAKIIFWNGGSYLEARLATSNRKKINQSLHFHSTEEAESQPHYVRPICSDFKEVSAGRSQGGGLSISFSCNHGSWTLFRQVLSSYIPERALLLADISVGRESLRSADNKLRSHGYAMKETEKIWRAYLGGQNG